MNGEQFIAFVCSLGTTQQTFNFNPFADEPTSFNHVFNFAPEFEDVAATPRPAPRPGKPALYHPQPVRRPAIQDAIRRFEEMAQTEDHQTCCSGSAPSSHPPMIMTASQRRPNPFALPENEQSTLPAHRRVIERPMARRPQDVLQPTPLVQQPSDWAYPTKACRDMNAGTGQQDLESNVGFAQPSSTVSRNQHKDTRTWPITFRQNTSILYSNHPECNSSGRPRWPPRPTFVLPRRRRTPIPSPRPSSPDQDTEENGSEEEDSDYEEECTGSNESTDGEGELEYITDDDTRAPRTILRQASESDSEYSEDSEGYYTAPESPDSFGGEPEINGTEAEEIDSHHPQSSSTESESPPLSPFSWSRSDNTERGVFYTQTISSTDSTTDDDYDSEECAYLEMMNMKPALPPPLAWLKGMPGREFSFLMALRKPD